MSSRTGSEIMLHDPVFFPQKKFLLDLLGQQMQGIGIQFDRDERIVQRAVEGLRFMA